MSIDLDSLMKTIEEWKKERDRTDLTKAEKLVREIMYGHHTKEELLDLKSRVEQFTREEATPSDIALLRKYTECLYMACQAIENGLM